MVIVSGLYISPIKSCKMIRVPEMELVSYGAKNDRIFMLTDQEGNFLSQRRLERLCLVEQEIKDDVLLVTAPGMSQITVPLEYPEGPEVQVVIHRDVCSGVDVGDEFAVWFSEFLGHSCRFIGYSRKYPRFRFSNYLQRVIELSFSDGYHLLGISEESLADLNSHLEKPMEMDGFRPNVVFKGCNAYEEDAWVRIRIWNTMFEGASTCVRCRTTTVNQRTAEVSVETEPLRTLAKIAGRKTSEGVIFGRNFVRLNGDFIVEGDIVHWR